MIENIVEHRHANHAGKQRAQIARCCKRKQKEKYLELRFAHKADTAEKIKINKNKHTIKQFRLEFLVFI